MDGTEKLPLLMIGKSRNPRCFKNVKSKPIEYHSNTKAWMTANIFETWLLDLNRTYQRKNRKIILFINNCTAHKLIPTVEIITVVFSPPNMTSVVQPMDQGIIKNLKHFYRCLVVQHLLTESSHYSPRFSKNVFKCMVQSQPKNNSKLLSEGRIHQEHCP
nr:tigger transposable element-derived protein 4-like [Parasteatoda tepidariorum]